MSHVTKTSIHSPRSQKLRVAMVVWTFPTLSQTFVLDQIRGLLERNHDVDIFALKGPWPEGKPYHADFDRLELQQRTFAATAKPQGILQRFQLTGRLLCRQLIKNPQSVVRWAASCMQGKSVSLRCLDAITPRIFQNTYDIAHCQFGTLGNLSLALEQIGMRFKRLVVTYRGYDISSVIQHSGPRVYDRLFKRADMVMPNCDFFRSRLIELNCDPAKLRVHRSGIACDRFIFRRPLPPVKRPVRLITVGRLVEKKGILYALEAVAGLVAQGMVVEYRIIGEGPQKEQCTRFIRNRGLQDVVKLIGNLPQQSVIRHLHESDLFIAANVTAQNGCLDGPINTAKEAMATGLPIVATRQGGIPELVEEGVNGFLVPQHDSKALQERVGWLIKHTDTWCQLAEAGRRHVEQEYDLEYWNEMLVQRYFEALNSPSQIGGLDEQSPSDNRRHAA